MSTFSLHEWLRLLFDRWPSLPLSLLLLSAWTGTTSVKQSSVSVGKPRICYLEIMRHRLYFAEGICLISTAPLKNTQTCLSLCSLCKIWLQLFFFLTSKETFQEMKWTHSFPPASVMIALLLHCLTCTTTVTVKTPLLCVRLIKRPCYSEALSRCQNMRQ